MPTSRCTIPTPRAFPTARACPRSSGYIVLMLMVPKNWKELQVTYMPTFAPDKTLTFTMKAADVIRG